MVNIEIFSSWIKENTNLSDSSIYKYSCAVNTISNEMQAKGVIPCELFNMSALQYDYYLPQILIDVDFVRKDTTGRRMYSNALKQYRMFRKTLPDDYVSESEIEQAIYSCGDVKTTERSALVKSRIGQGIFREALLAKYNNTCIITGISCIKLLIASHIKPWAASNNEERLCVDNGLLLSPTYDKLFDYGLITFTNSGKIIASSQLSTEDRSRLRLTIDVEYDLKISSKMKQCLDYHRDIVFVRK